MDSLRLDCRGMCDCWCTCAVTSTLLESVVVCRWWHRCISVVFSQRSFVGVWGSGRHIVWRGLWTSKPFSSTTGFLLLFLTVWDKGWSGQNCPLPPPGRDCSLQLSVSPFWPEGQLMSAHYILRFSCVFLHWPFLPVVLSENHAPNTASRAKVINLINNDLYSKFGYSGSCWTCTRPMRQ